MDARSILTGALAPVLHPLGEDPPPRPTEPTGQCVAAWMVRHTDVICPWLEDDDLAEIATLHRRLLSHSGYPPPHETKRDIAQLGVPASISAGFTAPVKEVADIASVAGYGAIRHRTIRRWADAGKVRRDHLDDGAVHYNFDDVLTLLRQRRDDLNDMEQPMTADRDIITVYERANCVACRETTKRLDKLGLDCHYIDVDTVEETTHLRALATRAGGSALPIAVADHPDRPRTVWSGLNIEKINELATIATNDVADAA